MEWQPIETAPRDQNVIVCRPYPFGDGRRVCIARYDDDACNKNPRPYWRSSGQWASKTQDRLSLPTHWTPLPEPPECGEAVRT